VSKLSKTGTTLFLNQRNLAAEASLIQNQLELLERDFVKLSGSNSKAARLIQEAIKMKRRRLESIERQREKKARRESPSR